MAPTLPTRMPTEPQRADKLRRLGRLLATLCGLVLACLLLAGPAAADLRDALEERLERAPVGPYDGRYRGEVTLSIPSCGKPVLDFGIVDSKLFRPRLRNPEQLDVRAVNGHIDETGHIEGIVTIGQYNYPLVGDVKDGVVSGSIYSRKVFCNGVIYEADIFWSATRIKSRVAEAAPAASATPKAAETPAENATPAKKPPKEAAVKSAKAAPADRAPPEIEAPPKITADASSVTIEGVARDASAIIEFTVDGSPVTLGKDGRFSVKRGVPQGESQIKLAATDEWGNTAERVVTVERVSAKANQAQAEAVKAPGGDASLDSFTRSLGHYVALVIGNDRYQHLPPLKTAAADAGAIAELLEQRYGFKTTVLRNATRRDVLAALASLRTSLKYDDNLVIYYAGHGFLDEVTERGYWLPVDAEADNPANWISNADVTDMLKALPSRAVLVIADSCYAGTLTRAIVPPAVSAADRRAFLERVAAKRARSVLASGGLEPVADSGGGKHSVFSKALIDILSENESVIDAQSLFAPIRQRVVLNAEQTPEYADVRLAGHEGGEFIFVPR